MLIFIRLFKKSDIINCESSEGVWGTVNVSSRNNASLGTVQGYLEGPRHLCSCISKCPAVCRCIPPKMGIFSKFLRYFYQDHPKNYFYCIFINILPNNFQESNRKIHGAFDAAKPLFFSWAVMIGKKHAQKWSKSYFRRDEQNKSCCI